MHLTVLFLSTGSQLAANAAALSLKARSERLF